MMEDEKVAKSFISAIIEEEVVELDLPATRKYALIEKEGEERERLSIRVCWVKFSAKIALQGGGFKSVTIELQKAKFSSDIMQFHRHLKWLHKQHKNLNNTYVVGDEKKDSQIYCIFLLGYNIGYRGYPVLQIDPGGVKDFATKEYLPGNIGSDNEFVQTLNHLSWIVQIDQLKQRRCNDIEKLLNIFDQGNCTKDHHIMDVNKEDFPDIYRPIIRCLCMASKDEQIMIEMEMEDDYWKGIHGEGRFIDNAVKEKVKALKEKIKALKEKDKVIEEKDKEIEELKKQLEILKAI
jgi:hypothetical protein